MKIPIATPGAKPARCAPGIRFLAVAALLSGVGGTRIDADELPVATPVAPTPESRAAYWLDRIVRGPEPTSFEIPSLHKDLLLDAERNLVAIPDATLTRLADVEIQRRVQTQDDANPWHAILSVLVQIGTRQPDVARAWAVPALRHELLTLRRGAIEVFEVLHSPIDGPALLEAVGRDATDRLIGPRAALILLKFGSPWDTAAARVVYARAPADGLRMSRGLWADLPSNAAEAAGGARPDLLAWWSFLTESAGPRRADPTRGGNGKGRAIDPEILSVVAVPHALTSGARAAAAARLQLAQSGNLTARAQLARDQASADPDVRDVVRVLVEHPVTEAERAAIREKAALFVSTLPGTSPPTPDDVSSVAKALRTDESPDALRLLTELFRAIPVDPQWKVPVLDVFDGLVVRAAPLGPEIERLVSLGTHSAVDLALFLARRSGGPTFIPVLEHFLKTPAAEPYRLQIRRELLFLYTGMLQHGGLPDDVADPFARTVVTWIEDESDRSAVGFVAVLADLGPAGEAQIIEGLRGAKRTLYVEGLVIGGDHYLGADVTAALVAPLDRRMPKADRRRILGIVFHIASSAATTTLEGLRARLAEEGRSDVDPILRIASHRYSLGR